MTYTSSYSRSSAATGSQLWIKTVQEFTGKKIHVEVYLCSSQPVLFKGPLHNQSLLLEFPPAFSPGSLELPHEDGKLSGSQGFGQSLLKDFGSQPYCGSPAFKISPNFHLLCRTKCCDLPPSVEKDTVFHCLTWGAAPCKKTTNASFLPSVEIVLRE